MGLSVPTSHNGHFSVNDAMVTPVCHHPRIPYTRNTYTRVPRSHPVKLANVRQNDARTHKLHLSRTCSPAVGLPCCNFVYFFPLFRRQVCHGLLGCGVHQNEVRVQAHEAQGLTKRIVNIHRNPPPRLARCSRARACASVRAGILRAFFKLSGS